MRALLVPLPTRDCEAANRRANSQREDSMRRLLDVAALVNGLGARSAERSWLSALGATDG
jgi:hypothetical protein